MSVYQSAIMEISRPFAGSKVALAQWRFVLGMALLSAAAAWLQIGQPLDLTLRFLWNKSHVERVSGRVVLVGIDDKALSKIGPWPWSAAELARLDDGLFRAGARRVFYDLPLLAISDERHELLASIERHADRTFVAATLSTVLDGKPDAYPANDLDKHVTLVATTHLVHNWWNGVEQVYYRRQAAGIVINSAESVIAGVTGSIGETFPIDYSYNADSVPSIGASELLAGQTASAIRGKDVVVGFATQMAGTGLTVPGKAGRQPNATVLILGAETLIHGRPVVVGWLPAWMGAVLAFLCSLRSRRFSWLSVGAPLAFTLVLCLPLLTIYHVFADVAPSLIFLTGVTVRQAWRRFGARQKTKGSINPVSGLPTPNAIRHEDGLTGRLLVAARIRNFANVLSTLPPHSEEALTRQVVNRLELAVGDGQLLHGDDGNFFWLADSSGFDTIVEQFEALHVLFRAPVRVDNKAFDLDVSFGLDRELALPLSHRMVTALAAAHAAEQEGICWKLHDPSAAGDKEWQLSLLGELDQAIQAGRVWVAYQPKFDLRSGRMIGAEALVRWTHETRGPISPSEFVEMAERHGRIEKLTTFVLDEAMKLTKQLVAIDPGFQVSVNISPSLLNDATLYEIVMASLARYELPPRNLMLEVTETAAIAREEAAQLLMKRFRAADISLSIDDYGTGLSTLEYLRKIPACELKIDRQFTAELCSSSVDQVVMRSTIQLAHALGMKAVAEGIETGEALQILTEMGCDIGQGYHLARPGPGDTLLSNLQVASNRTAANG